MSSQVARDYFEFLADLGMTKHYGNLEATQELVEICRIDKMKYVLDVGCGVGATPCSSDAPLVSHRITYPLWERIVDFRLFF